MNSKLRDIKVAFNSNGTVRWATHELVEHPYAEEGILFREVTETGDITDSKKFDCPECLQKFAGSFEEFWNNRNSVKVPWNDLTEAQKALRAFIHGTTRGIAIMKDKAIEESRK